MQRVHEGLANRLVQRCLLKRKPPRQLDLVGLCAEASNLVRKRCTDWPGNAPLCKLGRNVAGKLLQDECPQHSHPQSAPELAAGVHHGRAQASPCGRRGGEYCCGQWAEHEAEAHPQHTEVPPTTPAVSGTLSCMLFSPLKSKSTTVISLPLMPHAARGVERRRRATSSGSSICT